MTKHSSGGPVISFPLWSRIEGTNVVEDCLMQGYKIYSLFTKFIAFDLLHGSRMN